MAELLVAGDSDMPNAMSMYLREMLPQEYTVVSEPTVHRCLFDAVVVGPNGLVALQASDGVSGDVLAAPANPSVCGDIRVLQAFVSEEFPSLRPSFRQFAVERDPASPLPLWRIAGADPTDSGSLADAITADDAPADPVLADEALRDGLAVALRDRRLTASQRTTKPFVFRSSRLLGLSAKAWSIREAVAIMDRHPDDGIYHLCNGTLERWLRDEGAPHLAQLAHNAVIEGKNDRRCALEIFLVGTGLVSRPEMVVRPKVLDLGYVLNGAPVAGLLRLQHGRGRGYLFGSLTAGETWLRLDPKEFAGRSTDIVVTADTSLLPIVTEPVRAGLLIETNASNEPIPVPVQFHIATTPSRFNRIALRPLAGLSVAGLLGVFLGLLFGIAGVPAPLFGGEGPLFSGAGPLLGDTLFWVAAIGSLWALLGLIRGAKQPQAWPIHYATVRWLRRILVWAGSLMCIAVLAVWGWVRDSDISLVFAALGGLAAGVLPATIGELQAVGALDNPALLTGRYRAVGSVVRTAAGVLLLVALLSAPRLVVPTLESPAGREALRTVQVQTEGHWQRLNEGVGGLMTQLYLRYYDRRVPIQPTPAPPSAPRADLEDLFGFLRASR
jgi:hypothetical protein